MRRTLVASLVFLSCSSLAPVVSSSAQVLRTEKTTAALPTYIIQPGDVLLIDVNKEPRVTGEYNVRSDGRISLPYIQDVQAGGFSPEELKGRIEARLTEFIDVPNVAV